MFIEIEAHAGTRFSVSRLFSALMKVQTCFLWCFFFCDKKISFYLTLSTCLSAAMAEKNVCFLTTIVEKQIAIIAQHLPAYALELSGRGVKVLFFPFVKFFPERRLNWKSRLRGVCNWMTTIVNKISHVRSLARASQLSESFRRLKRN